MNTNDPDALQSAAGQFDLILSTVNQALDWNRYLSTLRPKGRLHFVGAVLDALDIAVFPMILGQYSISGSPVGSPNTMRTMLEFAVRHNIKPAVEFFSFEQVNQAVARLESGKARYRIVLSHAA